MFHKFFICSLYFEIFPEMDYPIPRALILVLSMGDLRKKDKMLMLMKISRWSDNPKYRISVMLDRVLYFVISGEQKIKSVWSDQCMYVGILISSPYLSYIMPMTCVLFGNLSMLPLFPLCFYFTSIVRIISCPSFSFCFVKSIKSFLVPSNELFTIAYE